MNRLIEINFDGLIGPTHNYAGLAYGNVASQGNVKTLSSPKNAALQGLDKMALMLELGVPQAILPPHPRPYLNFARAIGFNGSDQQVITAIANNNPEWLAMLYSASSMWTANAATISPSSDTVDHKFHLTAANLISNAHRSLEAEFSTHLCQHIFKNADFRVHPPLLNSMALADEGAANHTRLWHPEITTALHLFVYGRSIKQQAAPKKYPARQSLEASESIARIHGLNAAVIYAQQNPAAIDAGVFHNDVIAVGNAAVLLCHAEAYIDQANIYAQLRQHFGNKLCIIEISSAELSLTEAVATYLFNSQLLDLPDGSMALIAPTECKESAAAFACINRILAEDNPIRTVHFINCRESMKNGGGPACLRLRVPVTAAELNTINPSYILTAAKITALRRWVEQHYRDKLIADDLRDPKLMLESFAALDALTQVLGLGSLYGFQR